MNVTLGQNTWYVEIVELPVVTEHKVPVYKTIPGSFWGLFKPRNVFNGYKTIPSATMVVTEGADFKAKMLIGTTIAVNSIWLAEPHIYRVISQVSVDGRVLSKCTLARIPSQPFDESIYKNDLKACVVSFACPENCSSPIPFNP